jgi:hypothetical protein
MSAPRSFFARDLMHLARSLCGISVALVAAAFIGYCSSARAEGPTVGAHLVTAHFGGHDLQPRTPGLYARADAGALRGLTGGVYRNSYARTSAYLGWTGQSDDRRFALTVGAVTGYPAAPVMPLLVPSARIPLSREPGGAALRVAFIPKPVRHGTAAGLHLSVEQEF